MNLKRLNIDDVYYFKIDLSLFKLKYIYKYKNEF